MRLSDSSEHPDGSNVKVLISLPQMQFHIMFAAERAESRMCLGVPMEVMAVDGYLARCSAKGIERGVSLFLLQGEPVVSGDFVLVHGGYAIQKMTAEEARSAWELLDAMLAEQDLMQLGAHGAHARA